MADGHPYKETAEPTSPPESTWEEIRRDIRSLIAEWREFRVFRALGLEFRGIEPRVLEEEGDRAARATGRRP